ncbi:hypothetical protein DYB32_000952 [Aphanomyces invadans]|uniref:Uncharacterized protein n=1 Tax=Aphanomyces invadans TaxID=157072 RepID=A0A3R6ZA77_9STRA|nr:hypothetical protein DYB32_000952 [Aphanomyces invadans]
MSMAVERTRELKKEDKHQVVKMLQSLLSGNKLAHGAYQKAATRFGLHRATISKMWKQFNKNDMGSKKNGRVSRRAKYTEEELKVRIASVPQIKPQLTTKSQGDRIQFCRSYLHHSAPQALTTFASKAGASEAGSPAKTTEDVVQGTKDAFAELSSQKLEDVDEDDGETEHLTLEELRELKEDQKFRERKRLQGDKTGRKIDSTTPSSSASSDSSLSTLSGQFTAQSADKPFDAFEAIKFVSLSLRRVLVILRHCRNKYIEDKLREKYTSTIVTTVPPPSKERIEELSSNLAPQCWLGTQVFPKLTCLRLILQKSCKLRKKLLF